MRRLLQLFSSNPAEPAPLPSACSSRLESWGVGISSTLLLFLCYFWSLAPSLGTGHDTGELAACCITQGIPHSPGYPLFTFSGWLVTRMLSSLDPAYALNLLCAFQVALSMGFLGAALSLVTRPGPALLATLSTGLSTAVWRQAVTVEVFALHLLLLSALLWLATLWRFSENPRRRQIVIWACFLFGCGAAHQHILALSLPGFLLYGALARGRGRIWGFSLWSAPVFLVTALTPYLVQMEVARTMPALNWGNPADLQSLLQHFLRTSYGTGMLNAASLAYDPRAGDAQVTAYFIALIRNYFPFPIFLLALLSLDRLLQSKLDPTLLLYLTIAFLYGPYFGKLGNQPGAEFYFDLMERFYSSSLLGIGGLVALGADWLLKLWPRAQRLMPLAVVMVMYLFWLSYPKASQRGHWHSLDLMESMLAQLPARSVLLLTGDLPVGTLYYLQEARGMFRDRLVIVPGLLSAPWYRDRLPVALALAAQRNLQPAEISNELALHKILEHLKQQGFTIYCNELPQGLAGNYLQQGLLLRRYDPETGPSEQERVNTALATLERLEKSPRRGPYQMDGSQAFWSRYCIEAWLRAYLEVARDLAGYYPKESLLAMDRVIAIENTERFESHLNRGRLRLQLGQVDGAAEDFAICLRSWPDSRLALEGMVEAQRQRKDKILLERFEKRLESLP